MFYLERYKTFLLNYPNSIIINKIIFLADKEVKSLSFDYSSTVLKLYEQYIYFFLKNHKFNNKKKVDNFILFLKVR